MRTGAWDKIGGKPQRSGRPPGARPENDRYRASAPVARSGDGGGRRGVWSFPIESGTARATAARACTRRKSLSILCWLSIADFTDPGDVIVDLFAGSGTPGVAALRMGRRFIGIECNAASAAIARERLRAEESLSTLDARRAGQQALFETSARPASGTLLQKRPFRQNKAPAGRRGVARWRPLRRAKQLVMRDRTPASTTELVHAPGCGIPSRALLAATPRECRVRRARQARR